MNFLRGGNKIASSPSWCEILYVTIYPRKKKWTIDSNTERSRNVRDTLLYCKLLDVSAIINNEDADVLYSLSSFLVFASLFSFVQYFTTDVYISEVSHNAFIIDYFYKNAWSRSCFIWRNRRKITRDSDTLQKIWMKQCRIEFFLSFFSEIK